MPPPEWPWDSVTLSAVAVHLGKRWIYRTVPRVAVEQDNAPWTGVNFLAWQKTELAVASRRRDRSTGQNDAAHYLSRVTRMLFNPEGRRVPASVTFVSGKNQITVFSDGTVVSGVSADVPEGTAQPGVRPRYVAETPVWEASLRRMYDGANRLIA